MPAELPEEGGARRSIVRQVVQTIRCGACGARYRDENLTVVENSEGVWMLMAVCPGCDTQAMVMVVFRDSLHEEDAEPAIDSDDVLDFHRLMAEHEGDVRSLLTDDA